MIVLLRLLVLTIVVVAPLGAAPAVAGEDRAVLITGASTGIGRNMAETLAAEGYVVYAGARKEADLAELDALENVKGVRLDVTSQADVDAAVKFVQREGRGLYALVNNAGVGTQGAVADLTDAEIDFVFDVNVKGVARVTRAFIPLIAESKGRIVTTGSIAGFRAGPGGSVYSMSKFSVEAFTDSLAAEMQPLGVQVSIIEPGAYKSRIRRTAVARMTGDAVAAGVTMTDEMRERGKQIAASETSLDEPDDVSVALVHALSADTALRRYMVTPTAEQAASTLQQAIQRLVELNEWEQNGVSRDELVEMLDAAMTK